MRNTPQGTLIPGHQPMALESPRAGLLFARAARRLAAALVAIAMLVAAAPASGGTDIWSTTLGVKNHNVLGDFAGYGGDYPGATSSDNSFTHMATDYSFTGLAKDKTNYKLFLSWSPLPTVQRASAWTLHIGSQSMAFSNLSREGGSWTWTNSSLWSGPNTPFRDGATVEVRISTNAAPTASAGTVMATEDTAYPFTAANFNFSDADTSDTLSAVSIETLPALGTLALSGTAVSAMDEIASTDLDAGNLTYTPPADGYGDALASFTCDELFRRMDNAGVRAEWGDILRDLNALSETTITYNAKSFAVRSNAVGVAGKIAQCVGVRLPNTVRRIEIEEENTDPGS